MNDREFEKIMAYFDEELEPEQQADVEKLLAEDAEAREFLAQLRESDQFVQGGLNSILDEPVPQHLIDAARGAPSAANEPASPEPRSTRKVVDFPKKPVFSRWAYATAASVTLLVAASAFIISPGDAPSGLAQALNESLEQTASGEVYSQPEGAVQVMPVATFKTAEAGVCRQFAAKMQDQQTVGLACRSGEGEWQIRASETLADSDNAQAYIPASGNGGVIAEALQSLDGGEPLSSEQEQALMSDRWQ
ncbi:anti-sigma factor [Marinobacter halotolerans]|uniref:hypothetical protein n=1 Tax=Marinobacter halotolerans TaxID=1569211 RepID=UPI001247E360|nr:hypothetical protein [Marinobacter halotolerans]